MSNDKLAEALREPAEKFAQAMEKDADRIGGEWKTVLTTAAQCIRALLQAHAAEAARAQAQVPGAKYPDDGCGDEDSYNAGWNACRDAMLSAAPQQAAEPVAVIESAEDRHGPYLTHANVVLRVWNGYVPKAGDEIYTHPQPAQDARLPSDEDFRLHLGELTSAELRVAQAAFRYAMAKESGNG